MKGFSVELKIAEISKYFLGIPYEKNTLLGSPTKEEELVINFEGVDCMTFIEYVEALRLSDDLSSFIENLKHVRYFDGIVDFKKRRHFFIDWQNLKSIRDVTEEITDRKCYIVMKNLNFIEGIEPKLKIINYIPAEAIEKIVSKLKTGDYCGFYTSKEGLDVIHVGIIIRDENNFRLRHASSIKGYVVDEDFFEYSRQKEGMIIFRPQEI
ncbi:putative lipoprotein [Thermodesulfovibrio sp. N1]|uniref:N-acetylmuramoyl-L-alanine amidase-like domain-containing protein n=1 Tax=Thermodesulfovibrio sp. N1 TaxID=1871110 RepID=UPI0008582427|nr:N-acetylmuramoyl-L-alanine amidase-like domain-containing protein [Thermodesulfovibrio sp. N1]ODA43803.1 putative lipoprotein [Thermodesulfovibrio sp. N1]